MPKWWPFGLCLMYEGYMSVCPIYLVETDTFSPGLFYARSTALRLALRIYIDLAHNILPLLKLTTGSSEPILIITDPSSNPIPIILVFSREVSTAHPIPKLYSSTFSTLHELVWWIIVLPDSPTDSRIGSSGWNVTELTVNPWVYIVVRHCFVW